MKPTSASSRVPKTATAAVRPADLAASTPPSAPQRSTHSGGTPPHRTHARTYTHTHSQMYPLFFPPQLAATAPHAIAAPECFRTQVDYADTCHRYAGYGGERVFRRPRPCRYCGDAGGCECSEDASLEPGDVEVSIRGGVLQCRDLYISMTRFAHELPRSSRSRSSCTSLGSTPSGFAARSLSAAWRRANGCATSLTALSASLRTASRRRALCPQGPRQPAVSRHRPRRCRRSYMVRRNHPR